jgi:hypothetical protein
MRDKMRGKKERERTYFGEVMSCFFLCTLLTFGLIMVIINNVTVVTNTCCNLIATISTRRVYDRGLVDIDNQRCGTGSNATCLGRAVDVVAITRNLRQTAR